MSEYRIFETDPFGDDIDAIARSGRRRILEKLRQVVYPQLRDRPQFGANVRKPRNYDPPTWRYRIGSWRFFYEIDELRKFVLQGGTILSTTEFGGKEFSEAILLSEFDLTAGLVGYRSLTVNGYSPDSAFKIVRNIILYANK